jgi:hypothetical protein
LELGVRRRRFLISALVAGAFIEDREQRSGLRDGT